MTSRDETHAAQREPGARERNRAEVMAQIMAAGRRELTEHGADGLSLRAVAREIGMVSSAVYRYVASRDELLTLLIVESYDSIGLAAERAAQRDGSAVERFVAIAHAVRDWARKHPQEYTLIHGSPVRGYSAPQDTIASGTRVPAAMFRLLIEVHAEGRVAAPAVEAAPISPTLAAQCDAVREFFGEVDLPDELVLRGIAAWTQVYGLITFELFGQLQSTFEPADELMEHEFALAAARIGF